jgi:RNA-directed DNA polymerase
VADGVAVVAPKAPQVDPERLRHRYCGGGWWPASEEHVLIDLEKIGTTRYRYRGAIIPSPWPDIDEDTTTAA